MAHLDQCRSCGGWVSSDTNPPCPHCGDKYITEKRRIHAEKEAEMQKEMSRLQAEKHEEKKKLQAEEYEQEEEIMAERKRNKRCPACGGPTNYVLSTNGHHYVCANKCSGHFRY